MADWYLSHMLGLNQMASALHARKRNLGKAPTIVQRKSAGANHMCERTPPESTA
jgi:hypothetical protein